MSRGLVWTPEQLAARGWVKPGSAKAGNAISKPIQPRRAGKQVRHKETGAGMLQALCAASGLPLPVPEFRFHPTRRWRLDWAWPTAKVALEVDGGAWTQGRHTRGTGFIEDQRKGNQAVIAGWRVLHTTPDRLQEAIDDLRQLL